MTDMKQYICKADTIGVIWMSDLISRQAAIRVASGYCHPANIAKELAKLPSAQPERKTGRWIHDGYAFRGGIDWMHCSECGHKDSWSAATRTPFCAWCGSKMEGES